MRFGCCGNMVAVGSDGIGIEIIEQLKDIGYDYIELPLAQIMALSDDQFNNLKQKVLSSGLNCECCNNFFPANMRLTGEVIDTEKIIDYVYNSIRRASELGAQFIVFGSGAAKNVPEGFSMDKAWKQLVSILRSIDEIAKKYRVTIVIEPLRKPECNIINSVKEGLRLAKEVDRENIKLLADFYHMAYEGESEDILFEAGNYIKHVHFASPQLRTFPKVLEDYNYFPFINNLRKAEYNGRISIEAFSKNFYTDAKDALYFLKNSFN